MHYEKEKLSKVSVRIRRAKFPDLSAAGIGRYRLEAGKMRSDLLAIESPAIFAAATLMSAFQTGTPFKQEFPTTNKILPFFFVTRANSSTNPYTSCT